MYVSYFSRKFTSKTIILFQLNRNSRQTTPNIQSNSQPTQQSSPIAPYIRKVLLSSRLISRAILVTQIR